jgi:hypothetical protein
MSKHKAELVDSQSAVVATFNETCHKHGSANVTVRFRTPLTLSGTESFAIYAEGSSETVISVKASDPDGTEIREFHGTNALGCLAVGTNIALVRSPGGDLSTLLIVMAKGTIGS